MTLAIFANKRFYYAIWPLLRQWMQETTFRGWWHFKTIHYKMHLFHRVPDYLIVTKEGKQYLRSKGYRSMWAEASSYMSTTAEYCTSDRKSSENPEP